MSVLLRGIVRGVRSRDKKEDDVCNVDNIHDVIHVHIDISLGIRGEDEIFMHT